MLIDGEKYILPIDNYISIESLKKQIVLAHTFNHNMNHFKGWLHRHNKQYKKTAPFTIDRAGFIYKHFDPKYQSKFFNNIELDNKSIVILLENDGWLSKNDEKDEFITWIGDIYKQPSQVINKKWRGHEYWSTYTEEQLESVVKLVSSLCEEFFIPMVSVSHNTKIDDLGDYKGVIYKSNLEKHYTDLNPTWDFDTFKNKIELK